MARAWAGLLIFLRLSYQVAGNIIALDVFSTSSVPTVTDQQTQQGIAACKIKGGPGVYLSLGFGSTAGMAPSKPELKAGMLFVDFPSAKSTDTGKATFDALVPETIRWFNESSYGRLKLGVKGDFKYYTMPQAAASYKMSRGLTAQTHGVYIREAIKSMGGKSGFGKIDILYILPAKGAKEIGSTSTHAGSFQMADGTRVRAITFGPGIGSSLVLAHETGHTLGLPDLYPIGGGPAYTHVGGFDLMGWHYGTSPDYFAW